MNSLNFPLSNTSQQTKEHYFFYSLANVQKNFKKDSCLRATFEKYDFLKFAFSEACLLHISFVKKSVVQTIESDLFYKPFSEADHFVIPVSISAKKINNKQNFLSQYQKIIQQFDAYFLGSLRSFELDFQFSQLWGTPTFKKIWQTMFLIPSGQTETYGGLAKQVFGSNRYSRVVALACKRNPLVIVIPCHRIVGTNGKLTGYFYGLDVKKDLLKHESESFIL